MNNTFYLVNDKDGQGYVYGPCDTQMPPDNWPRGDDAVWESETVRLMKSTLRDWQRDTLLLPKLKWTGPAKPDWTPLQLDFDFTLETFAGETVAVKRHNLVKREDHKDICPATNLPCNTGYCRKDGPCSIKEVSKHSSPSPSPASVEEPDNSIQEFYQWMKERRAQEITEATGDWEMLNKINERRVSYYLRIYVTEVLPNIEKSAIQSVEERAKNHPPVSQDAHEKEIMMKAFDRVRKLFELRSWIMEGRGSYPYDDDRYKEEVRYLYEEFDALQNDTWANIQSKSFQYRQQIISDYLKDHPSPKWVKGLPVPSPYVEGERLHVKYKGKADYIFFNGKQWMWPIINMPVRSEHWKDIVYLDESSLQPQPSVEGLVYLNKFKESGLRILQELYKKHRFFLKALDVSNEDKNIFLTELGISTTEMDNH